MEKENVRIAKRQYFTSKVLPHSIKVDGIPDDAAWASVPWEGEFIQYQPAEGELPSEGTLFKLAFDARYLYFAFRCYMKDPKDIVPRMGRRDEFPGDWIEVNIDSYHDLRTAFSFTLSVSGVRGDELVSNNGNNWDGSWNPVWVGKTQVDDSGWTAEMRIPLSQLRYDDNEDKVWGLQVQRRIFHREERSYWQYIPQKSGAWVSEFGELRGLEGVRPQKQIEIAPYVVAQAERFEPETGNPFATGKDHRYSAGLDGKVALTSDLILDFTVNPDFGQVEADPSQVRIDGFQNFFEERRPFFIENRNIFDFQITGSAAGGDYDSDLLFYTRRIGGAPRGRPHLPPGAFADIPDYTTILGAAKFSGKTRTGWSVGLLQSVTQEEKAIIDLNGERREQVVEPLSSFTVARLQKDFDEGNLVVGGILTDVVRSGHLNHLLHSRAYSGGADVLKYWRNRAWYYKTTLLWSHVEGTPEAILRTQTAFEHYFQRPNNREAGVDINRKSLTGTGGTFRLGKSGGRAGNKGQVLRFETGFTWRSPQLELNDIGFMLTADEINHFTWAGILYQQPFSVFRNARISYNHWSRWDFSGQFLYQAFNLNTHGVFRNFWSAGVGVDCNPWDVSNNALRGASSLRKPAGMGVWGYAGTDSRKKLSGRVDLTHSWGFENTVLYQNASFSLTAQPLDPLKLSLSVSWNNFWRRQDQFVAQKDFLDELRTIVGAVSQQTLRLTFRGSYNVTPDLTIQYYGQPYITRPRYNHYAWVSDPLNSRYNDRFIRYEGDQIKKVPDGFEVDENRDGITDYSFSEPSFNFVQFRSNLIIRWEYVAGSELYLVWSQSVTPDALHDFERSIDRSLLHNLFAHEPLDIFLVKLTYRFLK